MSTGEGARLHSLDNLRAVMMWLGIVLHVSLQHMDGPSAFTWRDPATSPWADRLVMFIHCFRMPAFFIMAGFFAALLAQRRGAWGMLRHRLLRIGLPFVLFLAPLTAAVVWLAMGYTHLMHDGTWGIDPSVMPPPLPGQPVVSTMHLWFMYALVWMALAAALLSRLPPVLREPLLRALRSLVRSPWGFAVLALPLAVAGSGYPAGVLGASGSFLPPVAEWVFNGLFFSCGWTLYVARGEILPVLARRAWMAAGGGAVFFGAWLALAAYGAPPLALAYAYNCATWLWCFALTGLFVRHLPGSHPALRYLSESSYWVYLVHLPVVIAIGALLYPLGWGVAAKIAVNTLVTTAIGLATYQLLVRPSPLGRLLNGPREKAVA